jgi:Heavy-metal resistance
MKPFAKFLSIAAPSLVVGGLLFQSPVGHADDKSRGVSVTVKQKDNTSSYTWSGSVAGLDGIRSLVRGRLQAARQAIAAADMPPPVRAKVLARFDKVNAIVDRRLSKIDFKNLDQLEAQMEGLGEEIEAVMEGLEEELEELTKADPRLRGQLKQLGKFQMKLSGHDDGDDDDDDDSGWSMPVPPVPPVPPVAAVPPVPPVAAVPPVPPVPPVPSYGGYDPSNLGSFDDSAFGSVDLKLRPDQRAGLKAARIQSEVQVKAATKALNRLSEQLNTALRNPNAQPAEVTGLVDAISTQEATIRKAQILSWIRARALLDPRQRKLLEDSH